MEHACALFQFQFTTMFPLQVHKKYDLKGSTVDREASDKEKQKKEPTLKDMDFLNDGAKVKIGDEAKEKLLETLSADVEFLTKNDIMDYSLLLGIHDTKQAVEDDRDAEEEEDEEDEEYDSGGSGVALTPPESPGVKFVNGVYDVYKLYIILLSFLQSFSCMTVLSIVFTQCFTG